MPFLHVRSLPLDDRFDAAAAVRAVSAQFAGETGIEEHHDDERIVAMLRAAAGAVAGAAGVESRRVFAEFRGARSGQVLDGGETLPW